MKAAREATVFERKTADEYNRSIMGKLGEVMKIKAPERIAGPTGPLSGAGAALRLSPHGSGRDTCERWP